MPGVGALTAAGLASIVLGFVGRLVALRLGSPAMVLVVPASYALLPGLAIFRGLYEMVRASSEDSGVLTLQGGITTLLGAMAVLLAIATGTTLGELPGGAVRPPRWCRSAEPADGRERCGFRQEGGFGDRLALGGSPGWFASPGVKRS